MDEYIEICVNLSHYLREVLLIRIGSGEMARHCLKIREISQIEFVGQYITRKVHFVVWNPIILTILRAEELRDIFQHFFPQYNILYETMGVVATATITADSPQNTSRLTAMIYYLLIIFKRFKPEMVVSHRKDDDDDDSTPGGSGDGDLGTGPTALLAACSSIMEDEIWNTRASSITIKTSCQVGSSPTTHASKDREEEEVDRGGLSLPSDPSECDSCSSAQQLDISIGLENAMPTAAAVRPEKFDQALTSGSYIDSLSMSKDAVNAANMEELAADEISFEDDIQSSTFADGIETSLEIFKHDHNIKGRSLAESAQAASDEQITADLISLVLSEKIEDEEDEESETCSTIEASCWTIVINSGLSKVRSAESDMATHFMTGVMYKKAPALKGIGVEGFRQLDLVDQSSVTARPDVTLHQEFNDLVNQSSATARPDVTLHQDFNDLVNQSSATARPDVTLHQDFNDLVDQSSMTSTGIQSAIVFHGQEVFPCH